MGQHNLTAMCSGTCMRRRGDWEWVTDVSETTSFSESQISRDNQTVRCHFLGDKCRQAFGGTWPDSGSRPPLTWYSHHTPTHHIRKDSSLRVISPTHSALPDNTQLSQQTDIHAPTGIRTCKTSKPAAANPHLRTRGHWDRHLDTTISDSVLLLQHILSYSHSSPLYFFFSSSSFLFSPPPRSLFLPNNTGVARQQPYCNAITHFLQYMTASCFCSSIISLLTAVVSLPSLDYLSQRPLYQPYEHINCLQIICLGPICLNRTVATPEAVYSSWHYRLSQRCSLPCIVSIFHFNWSTPFLLTRQTLHNCWVWS